MLDRSKNSEFKLNTPEQIRMARGALRWTQAQLAQMAGVSVQTVKRIETLENLSGITPDTIARIERAFRKSRKISFFVGLPIGEKGEIRVITPENPIAESQVHLLAFGIAYSSS